MNEFKDKIYAQEMQRISDFVFDEKVAAVFDEMIQRSVPGYGDVVRMIALLAKRYAQEGSVCYDLGCSLGAVTFLMREVLNDNKISIKAIDNSNAMIQKCRELLKKQVSETPVEFLCEDIRNTVVQDASVVVLNFTLQFIQPSDRKELLQSIIDGMLPGGVLIISEKIRFQDDHDQDFQTDLHHEFKKMYGYSDLEISQKRTALENILLPESLEVHQKRLAEVGFERSHLWFQCFNFASMIAFKA